MHKCYHVFMARPSLIFYNVLSRNRPLTQFMVHTNDSYYGYNFPLNFM